MCVRVRVWQGVCHRDLKLENLLIDNNGHLKISDFGHAGIYKEGWDLFNTRLVGSLYHLSPEQVQGQCYSGEKIDIWALGVILYLLLPTPTPTPTPLGSACC
jgi:serine/threonine protein kinase